MRLGKMVIQAEFSDPFAENRINGRLNTGKAMLSKVTEFCGKGGQADSTIP